MPTVHLDDATRAAIKAYVATAGATRDDHRRDVVFDAPAPLMAAFSSRGPLLAGGGDLLKPDVIGSGCGHPRRRSRPEPTGRAFDLLSGTSMSSPHVAGLGALLTQAHP